MKMKNKKRSYIVEPNKNDYVSEYVREGRQNQSVSYFKYDEKYKPKY